MGVLNIPLMHTKFSSIKKKMLLMLLNIFENSYEKILTKFAGSIKLKARRKVTETTTN